MDNRKSLVVTVYGHNKTIDKIAVSSFDNCCHDGNESNAETYCDTINSLELKGENWVFAKTVSANAQYSLDTFLPLRFGTITALDDRAIQKILWETKTWEIAIALRGGDEEIEEIQGKIFNNMSKRAAKMLKEDMEYMGPVRPSDVKRSREKIVNIIRRLEETGKIVIPYSKGEIAE